MGTMLLDVPMTEAETIEVGDKMAEVLAQLTAVKTEKAAANKTFNGRIASLDDQLAELARQQREKTKKADVEVLTEYSTEHREMVVKRTDTGAIVMRRPATEEERQPELSLVPDSPTTEAGKTEEQRIAATPDEAEEIRDANLIDLAKEREAANREETAAFDAAQKADRGPVSREAPRTLLKPPAVKPYAPPYEAPEADNDDPLF